MVSSVMDLLPKKVTITSLLITGPMKKSHDYFAARYWALKQSNNY
jgi:hypothetical protein